MAEEKSPTELVRELRSTQCRCGKTKKAGETFCRGCYFSLPKGMRGLLYQRIGDGYEEAYTEAAKILDELAAE